ncbi:hypothetical protein Syun_004312 [Stephania yunnanensis]|uniref:Uncharacterized protein n=1 Tax=Stephania yunnanensis TaxID=152371 RepID=A0AAP0L5B4_9MAGN
MMPLGSSSKQQVNTPILTNRVLPHVDTSAVPVPATNEKMPRVAKSPSATMSRKLHFSAFQLLLICLEIRAITDSQ